MATAIAHQKYEDMFRPAVREDIGVFIGLAGESGSGKTWSAMALAKGIVGPGNRFAVIDTENRRARHYADDFAFDVLDLDAPYTSERYERAVKAAYATGHKAIVVDSATHEHEGEGGYLDASSDALAEMVKRYLERYRDAKEWEVREKLTPGSYKEASRLRKRMMYTMMACSATTPIIFCFRAEEQVWGTKDGKLVTFNPPRWRVICGKKMPFEMTVSLMMHADRPGHPIPIKLPDKFKALFPSDKPINEDAGQRLAEWARGGVSQPAREPSAMPASAPSAAPAVTTDAGRDTLLSAINQRRGTMKPSAFVATLAKHALSTGDFMRAPVDVLEDFLRDLPAAEPQGKLA